MNSINSISNNFKLQTAHYHRRYLCREANRHEKNRIFNIAVSILSVCIIFAFICSGLIIADAAVSNTSIETMESKYYTSINIEKGDSLWSIANKYTDGSNSVSEYVNEIKKINNLENDCIYEGQHLIIYYYATTK